MDQLSGMRMFARVVELGSFSKAAEDLSLSQSTITKNVALLEAHVRARLLDRNTRGLRPNEAEAVYYEKCKAILSQIDEADSTIRRNGTELDGMLRISTSVAFGEFVVAPLLTPFMRTHPRLRIDLTCEDGFVDLVGRGIDVALRLGNLADSALGVRYVGANPWVMVASPQYVAERGRPASCADLECHDCIVYSSVQGDPLWSLRRPDGACAPVGVSGFLRSNNLLTVLAVACAGRGVAILPRYVAHRALELGHLVEVLTDHALPGQQIYAVYPSPKLVSRKVTALIRHLAPQFRGEWWRHAADSTESVDCFPERITYTVG